MPELLEIIEKLQDTQAALARVEESVAQNPNETSLILTFNSLRKRQQSLEEQFAEEASRQGIDVCSYRLFTGNNERPTLRAITATLSDFQAWFTQTYNAIKKGPRERDRVTSDVLSETSFEYGYSFTGSVGFVLTLPNEKLLIGETYLDSTMMMLSKMVRLESSEQVVAFKNELGLAPIRTMYRWASDHVASGLGAEIEWRREQTVRTSLLVQPPQLESLTKAIARTSEVVEREFEIEGMLVGHDSKYKTFHMEVEGMPDIKGKTLMEIDPEHPIISPAFYRARIRTETIIHYSTEKEDVSYFLLSLDSPERPSLSE
jgi:hypothetical protein